MSILPVNLPNIRENLRLASARAQHWSEVLADIGRLFSGSIVSIDRISLGAESTTTAFNPFDARLVSRLSRKPGALGETACQALGRKRGDISALADWPVMRSDLSSFAVSSMQAKVVNGLALVLACEKDEVVLLSIQFPPQLQGNMVEVFARRQLELMAQDFLTAYDITRRLALTSQPNRSTIEKFWDASPLGLALVGADLQLLAINAAASDIFQDRRYFRPSVRGARLRPSDEEDDEAMQMAAQAILSLEKPRECFFLSGRRAPYGMPVSFQALSPQGCDTLPFPPSRHRPAFFSALFVQSEMVQRMLDIPGSHPTA